MKINKLILLGSLICSLTIPLNASFKDTWQRHKRTIACTGITTVGVYLLYRYGKDIIQWFKNRNHAKDTTDQTQVLDVKIPESVVAPLPAVTEKKKKTVTFASEVTFDDGDTAPLHDTELTI